MNDIVSIENALTEHRGNLFLSATDLGMTPIQLDSIIRKSEDLQAFVAHIVQVKKDSEYDRMSEEQFNSRLEQLNRAYRVEALTVIHELATMPYGESAAMAEVKLKAAVQLRGKDIDSPQNNGNNSILAELNTLYQQSAPRIKSIRVAQIEYQES